MDNFYDHICNKAKSGIPYIEATQLMLWMFLTVGYIPEKFRELELNKVNLAVLFAKLSVNGKINIDKTDNVSIDDITHPKHWENLIDKLLLRNVTLDKTFPDRFGRYV
jgi:hypothetical protein